MYWLASKFRNDVGTQMFLIQLFSQDFLPFSNFQTNHDHHCQEHPGEEETVAFNAGDGPLRVLGI